MAMRYICTSLLETMLMMLNGASTTGTGAVSSMPMVKALKRLLSK
jgi:hypothetical protein